MTAIPESASENTCDVTLGAVKQRIAGFGLELLGALKLNSEDPLQPAGLPFSCRSILLIGNAGSSIWPAFSQSPEYLDGQPDPLDRWSERVAGELSEELGAEPLFPFAGPPYQPFLRWAEKAGAGKPSPLGLTLHPDFGLWHGYRFALAFPGIVAGIPELAAPDHTCDSCHSKPCLQACPVSAFTGSSYQVTECAGFLKRNPAYHCNHQGCDARRQCPQGQQYHYDEAHARFHMGIFVANRAPKEI